MTLRTIPLHDLVVVLRRPFEPLVVDGSPVGDRRTGEPVHVAEAVLPGLVAGRWATDDRPSTVRLKLLGAAPEPMTAGTIVRLHGPRLTVWYTARGRGRDARSAATVTIDAVALAPGQVPAVRGGLPATTAGVGAMLLGQAGDTLDVLFDASGAFAVEGVAEVRCSTTVPAELVAQPVVLVGLRAWFTQPDAEDVGSRSKAELILSCSGVEPAPSANGRTRKAEAVAQ